MRGESQRESPDISGTDDEESTQTATQATKSIRKTRKRAPRKTQSKSQSPTATDQQRSEEDRENGSMSPEQRNDSEIDPRVSLNESQTINLYQFFVAST